MKINDKATQKNIQDLMLQAKGLLKEARLNFKVARKHLDAYNQYVPTEFPDAGEDDPRPCERWNLDNLLEGLPEMEKSLLTTCRRYFPDSVRLAPVRMNVGVGLSDYECKLAHICVARVHMRGMYEKVWEYHDTISKLLALRAVPYEMERNATRLESYAEFYSRKTYQQDVLYAKG